MTTGAHGAPRLRSWNLGELPPLPPASGVRMGLNESPYAPPPFVLDAVLRSCAEEGHRYPDPQNGALVGELAGRLGVPPEHLAVGAGLVALCRGLVHVTTAPGDQVVFAWPSFDNYRLDTVLFDAEPVAVPLNRHRLDLDAMAARVGARTRIIFVCSPNNPTGTGVGGVALARFLESVPSDVLVVLDEAYRDFATDPGLADGLALYGGRPRLCVLRTFSKAYGLAGLRAGYAVADPVVIGALRQVLAPFGLSRPAEAAARVALAHPETLAVRVAAIVAERDRLTGGLRRQGWPVVDSQANFVLLPVGRAAAPLMNMLASADIAVRAFPEYGVRITVGTRDDTDRLLAALRDPAAIELRQEATRE